MSDGFTPDDEFVRRAYRFDREWIGGVLAAEADAEFDRWLAAHDREVAAKEWGNG